MEILHLLQQFVKCQIVTLTESCGLPLSIFERGKLPFKNSSFSTLEALNSCQLRAVEFTPSASAGSSMIQKSTLCMVFVGKAEEQPSSLSHAPPCQWGVKPILLSCST